MKPSSILFAVLIVNTLAEPARAQTLIGFASLPADTFSPGPTSGQFIGPANGITPPFRDRQPVQGFSAVLQAPNGDLWVLPDNGFGAKANSADWVLRLYRVTPDFKTNKGGAGTIRVQSSITLRDPDRRIGFPIVADGETYPGGTNAIAVDPTIKSQRLLTGADLDVESVRQAPDGSFWFGDEFGPFLVHTDATGKLLEPPIAVPGVRSPQHPLGGPANLAASRGFEGVAMPPARTHLYPILEGAVAGDDPRKLRIYQFDLATKRFTDRQWLYRLDAAHSIGEFTAVSDRTFLAMERDDGQGDAARFKRIFLVSLDVADADGFLVKHQVADLLNLRDPDHLAGAADTFRFPFQTIESVLVLNQTDLLVLNDNNYPFSTGRTPGRADANEFIVIRLDRALDQIIKR